MPARGCFNPGEDNTYGVATLKALAKFFVPGLKQPGAGISERLRRCGWACICKRFRR
jgi:hypothetical protein